MGGLAQAGIFQLYAQVFLHKHMKLPAMLLLLYPLLLLTFAVCRYSTTAFVLEARDREEDVMADVTDEIVTKYDLIADFRLRMLFLQRFESAEKAYHRARKGAKVVLVHNELVAQWFGILLIAIYMYIGANAVIAGHLTLGVYVANIAIFKKNVNIYRDLYATLLTIMDVIPDLVHIGKLMNMETDMTHRMFVDHAKESKTEEELCKLVPLRLEEHIPEIDRLPILIQDVCFQHGHHLLPAAPLNLKGNVTIHQGELVCLVGPKGEGKSTLLRLICENLLPHRNEKSEYGVFVPAHLRSVQVADTPLFFTGTLVENLTFGMTEGHPDGHVERIIEICRKLGLTKTTCDLIKTNVVYDWGHYFSSAEQRLLCVARGLVVNPEILCLDQCLAELDKHSKASAMMILRRFVDDRGIEINSDCSGGRRPRTCLVVGCDPHHADRIISVSREHGLQQIPRLKRHCSM